MILSRSILPIIGTLFHPSYMMANAVYSDMIKPNSEKCALSDDPVYNENCISGETFQAAFGLGSSTMGILMMAPLICFNMGLTNLIPQAFGSKNYKLCGAYLNRMMVVQAMVFLPLLVPLQFIHHLFVWMGQPKDIAEQAAIYVQYTSPGLIFLGWSIDYIFFCQLQGKPIVNIISFGGASIIHFFLAYKLAITYDMKMRGLGIASFVQFFFRFLFAHLFTVNCKDLQRSLIPLFKADSVKDLGVVVQEGYNSFLLRVMSWWTFDMFTWFAAFLHSVDQTAAQSVLRNMGLFTYMIPFGLSNAANYYVGKFVGELKPMKAKKI
mmetsp:Transcript_2011/g.3558  ORF Transcript_2011/g.3558 Transcript_2011/m.3558 type:complete len:323 (-) Transcript_2011:489-1457(-)